jgi:hypothetical protein
MSENFSKNVDSQKYFWELVFEVPILFHLCQQCWMMLDEHVDLVSTQFWADSNLWWELIRAQLDLLTRRWKLIKLSCELSERDLFSFVFLSCLTWYHRSTMYYFAFHSNTPFQKVLGLGHTVDLHFQDWDIGFWILYLVTDFLII